MSKQLFETALAQVEAHLSELRERPCSFAQQKMLILANEGLSKLKVGIQEFFSLENPVTPQGWSNSEDLGWWTQEICTCGHHVTDHVPETKTLVAEQNPKEPGKQHWKKTWSAGELVNWTRTDGGGACRRTPCGVRCKCAEFTPKEKN